MVKFRIGDKAGVGVYVGSCGTCTYCLNDHENMCPKYIFTYNSKREDGSTTYGGFAKDIIVNVSCQLIAEFGIMIYVEVYMISMI